MEAQTFTKGAVRVALSCASKERMRYAFHGVLVEEGRMVATDGRRLVVVARSDAPAAPVKDGSRIVPREALEAASKGAKVEAVTVNGAVESKGQHGVTLATFPAADLEGEFPEWQAVMPTAKDMEGGITVRLSPSLLAGILSAIDAATMAALHEVAITVPAPRPKMEDHFNEQTRRHEQRRTGALVVDRPITITAKLSEGETATAVLMPITS